MRSSLAALVGVALFLVPAFAQDSRAKVQGTVTDASQAVIAGASIQLLNENTGVQATATTNASGQPYAQHRGGPKGFIRVLDDRTLAFADYTGNRQYITTGNLAENDKAFLFLMDYAHRRRIKIWGRARVVTGDAALIEQLMPENYNAKPEQAILFEVEAWDMNCPQHIPQKLNAAEVAETHRRLETRITELETEYAGLKALIEGID